MCGEYRSIINMEMNSHLCVLCDTSWKPRISRQVEAVYRVHWLRVKLFLAWKQNPFLIFVKFLHKLLSNVWFGQCFVNRLPALISVLLIQMACNYMDLRDACCRSVSHWSIISKGSTWALIYWTQFCIEHYIMHLASMILNILCDECVGLLSCSCKPWSSIQLLGGLPWWSYFTFVTFKHLFFPLNDRYSSASHLNP